MEFQIKLNQMFLATKELNIKLVSQQIQKKLKDVYFELE